MPTTHRFSRRSAVQWLLSTSLLERRALGAEPNTLTSDEQAQDWRLLFDGRTTNGWKEITGKPFPDSWIIENGCLKAITRPTGAQDIRTIDEFDSFELQWEWKLNSMGNSGLKYLVQNVDEWNNKLGRQARARGLEYQLADDLDPDAASDPRKVAGSLYSVIAPAPKVAPRIGEFNQSRLVVRSRRVEHWLNGTRVLTFDPHSAEIDKALRKQYPKTADPLTPPKTASPISLQNHSSEAWFRSIKIRSLAGAAPK